MSYLDDIPFEEKPVVIDRARPGDVIWQYTGPLKSEKMKFMLIFLEHEERRIRVIKLDRMSEEHIMLLNKFVKDSYDVLVETYRFEKIRDAFYEFSREHLGSVGFMQGGFRHAESNMFYHSNILRANPAKGIPNRSFSNSLAQLKDM